MWYNFWEDGEPAWTVGRTGTWAKKAMARYLNQDPGDVEREAGPLSLADLRDVSRLRQDLAQGAEEIRLLREQLGHALAGWHTEQQRALALEQRLKEHVSPSFTGPDTGPSAAPPGPETADGGADAEPSSVAGPGESPSAEVAVLRQSEDAETRPGLLAGLLNFLRD